MLFWYFLGIVFLFIFLVFSVSVFIGVPPLSTHKAQAIKMIEMAELRSGMKAVDLGSGTGRLLFLAAKRGVNIDGYELNPFLFFWTKLVSKLFGYENKVNVYLNSIYKADVKNADVVFAFLFPEPMKKLSSKLFSEMKTGTKIVSYAFEFPDKKPMIKEDGILIYKVGENN